LPKSILPKKRPPPLERGSKVIQILLLAHHQSELFPVYFHPLTFDVPFDHTSNHLKFYTSNDRIVNETRELGVTFASLISTITTAVQTMFSSSKWESLHRENIA